MNFICSDCINIKSVKEEIGKISVRGLCFYCDQTKDNAADKKVVFDLFKSRFMKSVIPLNDCSPMELYMFYAGSDELHALEIWEMILNLEVGSNELEDDLVKYINDSLSPDEILFVYDDGTLEYNVYEHHWSEFVKSISHKHRFFNDDAKKFLDSLFGIIQENGVILENVTERLDPNTPIFRARIANTASERAKIYSNPACELGPAPSKLAGEQRMTPTGIAAFYASYDRDTCFSEVRAITGDIVMSAEFKTTRTLKLLDLRKLTEVSKMDFCPLDENYSDNSHKSQFIQKLIFLLSKPASQRGSSTYLETQIIFEYLRITFGSDIYGLVFSSVQTGMSGINIVLFPECSQVQPFFYNLREKAECIENYSSEFGFYSYEIKTGGKSHLVKSNNHCLKFVENSISLHYIKAVKTEAKNLVIFEDLNSTLLI